MNTSSNDGLRTPLWTPSEDSIRGSRMFDFARWAERRHGIELPDYPSLHAWSVDQMNEFWQGVWDYFDVVASRPGERALGTSESSVADTGMPGAQWFPGARLNYAENSLRAARTRPDDVAIIGEHELSAPSTWTWGELEARVASVAQQLRDLGIVPGDRVAAVLPNLPETAVAMLATTSVGAVWSVVNTDFGPSGVADRFAQIEPRVLFVVDGYEFGGSLRDMTGSYTGLLEVLPTVEQLIVVDQQTRDKVGALPEGSLRFS